ncbi:DUF3892 domain-containing protein [Alcaligenes faecalis subsp. phenolicus]|uniref:DUF3892 domain-containing protein n=1 Tax=Alcaligenes nematophilus TaxID=2994643 RepID=UPI002AA4B5ED|nr:DUF3892 domain-containing protein [Alcaligenes phenolicus]
MAGLYIVAVRYSKDDTPAIERVKARYLLQAADGSLKLDAEHELSVDNVRGILRAEKIVIRTATYNPKDKEWKAGNADVGLYGDRYITTDANNATRDNLGELPEF